jgi:hypothetical protein
MGEGGLALAPRRWRVPILLGAAGDAFLALRMMLAAAGDPALALLLLADLAAAALVGPGLVGSDRIDPGADHSDREGDDVDRGLGQAGGEEKRQGEEKDAHGARFRPNLLEEK